MIDSTNPRILADNIRDLLEDVATLQTTVGAQGDAIEALGYYTETEVNTGMKYGEDDVYRKVFTGTIPTSGSSQLQLAFKDILSLRGSAIATNSIVYDLNKVISITGVTSNNTLSVYAPSAEIFQGGSFILIVEYTKAAPSALTSPAPDDTRSIEPEVREEAPEAEPVIDEPIEEPVKKTTRKKTTTTE